MNDLRGVVDPAILNALETKRMASPASNFQGGEIVGAQVGKVLQHQAELATLYSLGGMLVYLWFRFEPDLRCRRRRRLLPRHHHHRRRLQPGQS